MTPIPLIAGLAGACFCILAAMAILAFRWDKRTDDGPDVGLSILDRGEQDAATEAELLTWGAAIRVTPSPLIAARAQAERAGQFAEAVTEALQRLERRHGPGRHRALGPRDPHMEARLTTTQQFEVLAEEEGHPVVEHGPREVELHFQRTVSWVHPRGLRPAYAEIREVPSWAR